MSTHVRCLFRHVLVLVFAALLAPLGRSQSVPPAGAGSPPSDLAQQVAALRALVLQLETKVQRLEQQQAGAGGRPQATVETGPAPQAAPAAEVPSASDLRGGTTVNLLLDGYYAFNFDRPIGRVNLLRAYDVSSNAFSLNQADVVVEDAPDAAHGKRFGGRLDLQFGQATETLQGNAANEPRPEIYRSIFQAYGTWVAPVGSGLQIDFGKWASSLGIEGNYTKDQVNYSRSFWFNFLPFYHMGVRTHYQVTSALGLSYWVTNGTQQTEPFNNYKDELAGFVLQPAKNLTWTSNYYLGQEHPDFQFVSNGPSSLPTIQGMPFQPLTDAPTGKLNILDNYATWNLTSRLTLAAEGDYVVERLFTTSAPAHTDGGAAYASYQLTPRIGLGARGEYLSDRGGLFSGATQALKETTATLDFKLAASVMMFDEVRHDWSNQAYFLTDRLGNLARQQTTASVGLVFWYGGKQGPW